MVYRRDVRQRRKTIQARPYLDDTFVNPTPLLEVAVVLREKGKRYHSIVSTVI